MQPDTGQAAHKPSAFQMDLSAQHPQQQQQQPLGQPQELQGRQGDAGRAISAAHDPANAENRMVGDVGAT